MKRFAVWAATAVSLLVISQPLEARGGAGGSSSHSVRGYTTKNGVYVAPHRATNPNATKMDNWSTKGNVNPFTGKPGTVDPNAPKR